MDAGEEETASFAYDPVDLPSNVRARRGPPPRASRGRGGGVTIVEQGPPGRSTEASSLLQRRLRAATLALMFAFGAYFVRSLLLGQSALPVAYVVTLIILAGGLAALRSPLPTRTLRIMEVGIFWLAAAYLIVIEYAALLDLARQGDAAALTVLGKRFVAYAFVLSVTYSMLIPNTWTRATRVIIPLAMAPIWSILLLRLTHPEVGRYTRQVATFEQSSDNVLFLLLGATLAIFGTHVINALREEAREARQLAQYRLGERLGAGVMGEVFRAEHRLLKRPCAIKLIRRDQSDDPTALARFEREVRATAALSHPNTVEVYDYGRSDDGAFYYVMEYLPGLSLAELLAGHGPLPPWRVIYLLRQGCGALAEAHAAGLVHRDLKPANLFSAFRGGRSDVTKVLDFGLVQAPGGEWDPDLSRVGTIRGTPQYMAPEQAAGERRLDAACDLYALGAVAYFLLTGRAPFEGLGPFAAMAAHIHQRVEPPSVRVLGIPGDLEAVVFRCPEKSPAGRFAGAVELERALADCQCVADRDSRKAEQWWRQADPDRSLPADTSG